MISNMPSKMVSKKSLIPIEKKKFPDTIAAEHEYSTNDKTIEFN